MKISEMNKTLEIMKQCYPFKDEDTNITIGDVRGQVDRVNVFCIDNNGTHIEMTRHAEGEVKHFD